MILAIVAFVAGIVAAYSAGAAGGHVEGEISALSRIEAALRKGEVEINGSRYYVKGVGFEKWQAAIAENAKHASLD